MQSLFYDATLNWEVFFLFWTVTKVGAGMPLAQCPAARDKNSGCVASDKIRCSHCCQRVAVVAA
jgi:hypothetical protein